MLIPLCNSQPNLSALSNMHVDKLAYSTAASTSLLMAEQNSFKVLLCFKVLACELELS